MDGSKPETLTQSKLQRYFPPLCSMLIFAGVFSTAYLIDKSVAVGGFLWWPYPALVLLFAAIFAANWFIYRDESGR